jgi:hypothetical protein
VIAVYGFARIVFAVLVVLLIVKLGILRNGAGNVNRLVGCGPAP